MSHKPNIVVFVTDTMRTAELGCYGNDWIRTPHIDAFAGQSVRFTRAYPESLPTIPVRRALHTGRRCYPFRNYRPVKWDIVYLPGWQAMDNDEDTLAETLAGAGYQTGFVTDTLPYFAPGFNFQRGFWQWEYIRGQQQDRWKSPHSVSRERLARYADPDTVYANSKSLHGIAPMHLANTAHVEDESQTTTARTFQWAMEFVEDNAAGQPFYLTIDCFDPHEPWEAPQNYYEMYGDPNYSGRRHLHVKYAPRSENGYSDEEFDYIKAQYCGLVSLVDTWFGRFLDKLDELGLSDNTMVVFVSDHGTNFCDNPKDIIGKPAYAMYPGLVRLPLMVRMPDGVGAGATCDELVYNLDVTATVYDVAGLESEQGIDGQSLAPLIEGDTDRWRRRDYVTCRYGHNMVAIDDTHHIMLNADREVEGAFDLTVDPACSNDLTGKVDKAVIDRAWDRLLADAGGEALPDYREKAQVTDAIGQKAERC